MQFPVFPVRDGRFMTCVRVACVHTGNTGNTGNPYIYLLVFTALAGFPVGQPDRKSPEIGGVDAHQQGRTARDRERHGTGNRSVEGRRGYARRGVRRSPLRSGRMAGRLRATWDRVQTGRSRLSRGYLGQPIPCKSLVSQDQSSPLALPSGLPGPGLPTAQVEGERLAPLNGGSVRLPASQALSCYASNVQAITCIQRRLICCTVSIPRHRNHMRELVTSPVNTGFSVGPSPGRPPVAVRFADRAIYLYVLCGKWVVHGVGVGQSDSNRQVHHAA
jgi:hypothetical protein